MKPSGSSSTTVTILLLCLPLGACDWVDSAGNSGSTSAPVAVTEVLLDDMPAGDVIALNEQGEARITASRTATSPSTIIWSTEALEEGNLLACETQNGFNAELAAESLQQACASTTDCEFTFDAESPDASVGTDTDTDTDADTDTETETDEAVFTVRVPALNASVGVTHELSTTDELGNTDVSERTFCLIAINEAPVANDDTFVIVEGNVLAVTSETINLLTNDTDDTDVSNGPLSILPEAAEAPQFAASFELGTDGSFTYQPDLTGLSNDQVDTFDYQLTDGLFTSTATATIRIVAANQAPRQIAPVPPQTATEGLEFSSDLSGFFDDPEDGDISFSLSAITPLAEDSGLSLSPDGLLSGTPTESDVGSFELIIRVSDGGLATEARVTLVVDAAPIVVANDAPEFVPRTVFNQTVMAGVFITPVRPEFTDPDDDELTYIFSGTGVLPAGITVNSDTGTLSGRTFLPGTYTGLRVRATDPSGAFALSSTFSLTVTALFGQ